jgi:hypothetical protein
MNQNQQLEEIETTTLSNLDETKDMTDEVTEEVKDTDQFFCCRLG